MKSKLVIASGYWNLGLAFILTCPAIYLTLDVNLQQPVWGWLIAVLLFYTSASLIICGHNVKRYASIIFYEGLARFMAGAVLIPGGLFWDCGYLVALAGLIDIFWGATYMRVVPNMTGYSLKELLLNRTAS